MLRRPKSIRLPDAAGDDENFRGIQLSFLNRYLHVDMRKRAEAGQCSFTFTEKRKITATNGTKFWVKKGTPCEGINGRFTCKGNDFTLAPNNLKIERDLLINWTVQDVWEFIKEEHPADGFPGAMDEIEEEVPFLRSEPFECAYLICPREAVYTNVVTSLYRHIQSKEIRVSEDDYYVWIDVFCSKTRNKRDEAVGSDIRDARVKKLASEDANAINFQDLETLFRIQNSNLETLKQNLPRFFERLVYFDNFQQPSVLTRSWCVWELYCFASQGHLVSVVHHAPIRFQDKNAQEYEEFYISMQDLNPLKFIALTELDLKLMFKKFATLNEGFRSVVWAIQNNFAQWLTKQMRDAVYNFPATEKSTLTYLEALIACVFLCIKRSRAEQTGGGHSSNLIRRAEKLLIEARARVEDQTPSEGDLRKARDELIWKKGLIQLGNILIACATDLPLNGMDEVIRKETFERLPKDCRENLQMQIQFYLATGHPETAKEIRDSANYKLSRPLFGKKSFAFMLGIPKEEIYYIHARAIFRKEIAIVDHNFEACIQELEAAVNKTIKRENMLEEKRAGITNSDQARRFSLRKTQLKFQKRKYWVHLGIIFYRLKNKMQLLKHMDEKFFENKIHYVLNGSQTIEKLANHKWQSRVLPTQRISMGYGKRMFQIAVLGFASIYENKDIRYPGLEKLLADELCETGRCFYGWTEQGVMMVHSELQMLLSNDAETIKYILNMIYVNVSDQMKNTREFTLDLSRLNIDQKILDQVRSYVAKALTGI